MRIYTHTPTYAGTYTHTHTHTYTYLHKPAHTCTNLHIPSHTYTYRHVLRHIHIQSDPCICIYVYIYSSHPGGDTCPGSIARCTSGSVCPAVVRCCCGSGRRGWNTQARHEGQMEPLKQFEVYYPCWLGIIGSSTILPGLLRITITYSRESYSATSIMGWDRGLFDGSIGDFATD